MVDFITAICIVLNIIPRDDSEFLLIQEAKPAARGLWFFPAGRKDPHETVVEAAVRETQEEAGILTQPYALLNLEHIIRPFNTATGFVDIFRFILVSNIVGGQLKKIEDSESIQAQWFTWESIQTLSLRSPEVLEVISLYLEQESLIPLDKIYKPVKIK